MTNMQIWDQVEKSDIDHTKAVPYGSFKFTAIDAQSQLKRATEIFGPCGLGWGTRHETFEPIVVDPADPHYTLLKYQAQFFWKLGDQEGCFDIASDIELFEKSKNEWRRTTDPVKKCRTDAVTKALSWLGFNADVFLGKFEDQKYMKQLQEEKQIEKKQQAAGSALASADKLETIQRLAGQVGLAGAEFAQYLREKHSTTWSKLTLATAEKVIADLNQLSAQKASA